MSKEELPNRLRDIGNGLAREIPRTITADELREGQLICIHRGHSWGVRAIGEFQGIEGDVVTIKTGGSGTFTESVKFHTIVLLADEHAKDVCTSTGLVKDRADSLHVTAEDIRNSEPGSTWEWEQPEHDDTSTWEWDGEYMRHHSHDGEMYGYCNLNEFFKAGHALTRSTAAPRGTYPEPEHCDRGPCWKLAGHKEKCEPGGKRLTVSVEDIRNSEPGSTFEDVEGATWEWCGNSQFRHHALTGALSGNRSLQDVAILYGPFTRSNAAPRGTYPKPDYCDRGPCWNLAGHTGGCEPDAKRRGEVVKLEDLRKEKRWPTPNQMRRAADSIEQLTTPDYAGVLRYVADLCDNDSRIVVEDGAE